MGYYLPPKSYLRPKPRTRIKQKIVAITAAGIMLIVAGIIITVTQLTNNKSAIGKDSVKTFKTDSLIPVALNNVSLAKKETMFKGTNKTNFPVQLAYFKANQNPRTIELEWSTVLEENNDFFTIEKSLNGTSFAEIGCVDSKKSKELSSDYSFNDDSIPDGTAFYRLKQTSENGDITYIAIEKVSIKKEDEEATLYIENVGPNPFDKYFNVNYYSERQGGVSVELFDKSGKKVYKTYTTANQGYNTCRFIDGEYLNDSEYTVRIANSSGAYVKRIKKKIV